MEKKNTPVPQTATLTYNGRSIELPVVVGTEGEVGFDVSNLYAKTGHLVYDPGMANTAVCKSDISYIDGENGILRYRGIPIEKLSATHDFIETAMLLMNGKLPTVEERLNFGMLLTENANIHESMKHHFDSFPPKAHPMAILSAMVNSLFCYDRQFQRMIDKDPTLAIDTAAANLMSKVRTLAAYSHRAAQGLPYMFPDPSLRYCSNFLHMMFSEPYRQYIPENEIDEALNLILTLHADHEQNCSTTTVRIVGSAQANLYASVSAGICALWGPLHGGANVAVIDMLESIHRGGLSPQECIEKAKDKNEPFRLMGFGHRVYKKYDPRARLLKTCCDRVFKRLKVQDPLLDIARKLEELALKDSYFIERKLYPNVDFYSGIILRAIGIPTNMFTVIFAIGRMPGWIAQWKELYNDQNSRLTRPRQIYIGAPLTQYQPLTKRK
ncbi:citrate synthase [Candidatus Sumerlaeota bacterium]|nr:citrate synthase [Candidatus Sumerlaeales bacterium]NLD61282.1 citrate synthase [Candidatus Sumerlaeota bacterium]